MPYKLATLQNCRGSKPYSIAGFTTSNHFITCSWWFSTKEALSSWLHSHRCNTPPYQKSWSTKYGTRIWILFYGIKLCGAKQMGHVGKRNLRDAAQLHYVQLDHVWCARFLRWGAKTSHIKGKQSRGEYEGWIIIKELGKLTTRNFGGEGYMKMRGVWCDKRYDATVSEIWI